MPGNTDTWKVTRPAIPLTKLGKADKIPDPYTPVQMADLLKRVASTEWEMYFKIDIADTGRGIHEKEQAANFKRFYQKETVHDIDGIGIGFYLAREIITMQGGYIKVSSAVGSGSTFFVFLPKNEMS